MKDKKNYIYSIAYNKRFSWVLVSSKKDISNDTLSQLKLNFSNTDRSQLNSLFKEERVYSIGIIQNEYIGSLKDEIGIIISKTKIDSSHFIFLLPYEPPPPFNLTLSNQLVESFIVSTSYFLDNIHENLSVDNFCYKMAIRAIANEHGVDCILVHQLKHPNPRNITEHSHISSEVVIPHKGNLDELNAALGYLKKQSHQANGISVCFDEWINDSHYDLLDKNPSVDFYANVPVGLGPYPARDMISRNSEKEVLIFQDSDDVPTYDRFSSLLDTLQKGHLDAVGCHELRINKIDERVEAYRLPLDVNKATNEEHWFNIFFPTTAIKKKAYLKAGGLSTIRRHSSDSQFYLRAHFFLHLGNIDDFLYIRVLRPNSLTTHSDTGMKHMVRERLHSRWAYDFEKVRMANISLIESSLIDEQRSDYFNLIPIKGNKDILDAYQKAWEQLTKSASFIPDTFRPLPLEKNIRKELIRIDPGDKDYYSHMAMMDMINTIHSIKSTYSWKIGKFITNAIGFLFGWIPFIRRRM